MVPSRAFLLTCPKYLKLQTKKIMFPPANQISQVSKSNTQVNKFFIKGH